MSIEKQVTRKVVVLSKAQADEIERLRTTHYDYEIVESYVNEDIVSTNPLYGVGLEKLICALYVGYTVLKSPEEQLQDFCSILNAQQKEALRQAFNIMGVYIKGVNE